MAARKTSTTPRNLKGQMKRALAKKRVSAKKTQRKLAAHSGTGFKGISAFNAARTKLRKK